jgi:hypothetical protein
MKSPLTLLLALAVLVALSVTSSFGQMPRTLNYQGTLTTGSTPVPDGNYSVTFRLYTASTGGSAVWTEAQLVTTHSGVFNAILGKIVALPASFSTAYFMSLQVGSDPELSPRLEMTGVSYSLQSAVSDSANKVATGSIGTAQLANNSVTSAKIVDGTITGADVASKTLSTADILDEPGLSASVHGGVYLAGGTAVVCDSVDITVPAPGYVFVTAAGYLNLFHNASELTQVEVAISTIRSDVSFTYPGAQTACVPSGITVTGVSFQFPYSTSRVYQVTSAGTSRYYLNANQFSGTNASTNLYGSSLTAIYFPNLMGTLSKTTPGSQTFNESLGSDGTTRLNR